MEVSTQDKWVTQDEVHNFQRLWFLLLVVSSVGKLIGEVTVEVDALEVCTPCYTLFVT